MVLRRWRWLGIAAVVLISTVVVVFPKDQPSLKDEPNLTVEQKADFLLHAKVIDSHQTSKGVTNPWRLTLTDGTITHNASFQKVDERKSVMTLASGRTEINFKDSYHFNVAAYELAKLIGLDDMMPVTVARKWKGDEGSLTWWIPWKWDEVMRRDQHLDPPDPDGWNKQMYRKRVFAQLVYDTDPNLTNLLITEDWKIWMIDFTRAFRVSHDIQNPKDLEKCDKQLLERLRKLDGDELAAKTKGHLSKSEVQAVMARRDKIVAHFEKLVAEKGESEVLY